MAEKPIGIIHYCFELDGTMEPATQDRSNLFSRNLLTRSSPFGYDCARCCRCCHDKIIRVNPFEVAAMADQCGIATGEFIERYIEEECTTLRFTKTGACVFLSERGCGVHAGRPLVCRLYPLNRHTSGNGREFFTRALPHPQTEGIYRGDGLVADYLESQETRLYIAAADRFIALLEELIARFRHIQQNVGASKETALETISPREWDTWLDLDAVVETYCRERGLPVPRTLEERFEHYLLGLRSQLALDEDAP